MHSAISILVLLLVVSVVAAQPEKHISKNPPGTVRINDTLYADVTEVANVHWREYLYYLRDLAEVGDSSLNEMLTDTSVWIGFSHDGVPYAEFYHRHPGFNDYPVVGITYEQAVKYCAWRTFAANFFIYANENKSKKDWKEHLRDSFAFKFVYRLPTKSEWEMIAAGSVSPGPDPYGSPQFVKYRKKPTKAFNCLYSETDTLTRNGEPPPVVPIDNFFKNKSGCYNMIGNVAEMTSEKGIAKGGSFMHHLKDCAIEKDQYYSSPQVWLGFRCVAVLVSK